MEQTYCIKGINNYENLIGEIIETFQLQSHTFDIRLILTEGITNAYVHGNKRDDTKLITVQVINNKQSYIFKIKDSGYGEYYVYDSKELSEDLMDENGRGLYLINCFADKVEFNKNSLVVYKKIV